MGTSKDLPRPQTKNAHPKGREVSWRHGGKIATACFVVPAAAGDVLALIDGLVVIGTDPATGKARTWREDELRAT